MKVIRFFMMALAITPLMLMMTLSISVSTVILLCDKKQPFMARRLLIRYLALNAFWQTVGNIKSWVKTGYAGQAVNV